MKFAAKRAFAVLSRLQAGRIQKLGDQLTAQKVLLLQQEVERVVGERRVVEAFVAGRGGNGTRRLHAHRPLAGRPHRRGQADGQPGVGCDNAGRVLDQRCGGRAERTEEGDRIGTGHGILGDTEAVENRRLHNLGIVC